DHPLLDLTLLRSSRLVGLLAVPVAGAVGFVTLLTYYPTFLSTVWQLETGVVGLVMLIMTVPVIVGPLIAGALHTRGVPVWVILGGSVLLFAAGAALLTLVGTEESIGAIGVPYLLLGLGFGLGVGLVDGQAIGSVPAEKSGMVSGLVSTVRLGSEAVVVAVFASALTAGVGGEVRDRLPGSLGSGERESIVDKVVTGEIGGVDRSVDTGVLRAAFSDGFTSLLWVLAALSLVLAVVVALLLRRPVATPITPGVDAGPVDADSACDPEEIRQ
ncbi:MAG: MFS transporter, partial [Mycobacterium sp.]|nr:MFS transporter [Mycobacterium sp.]